MVNIPSTQPNHWVNYEFLPFSVNIDLDDSLGCWEAVVKYVERDEGMEDSKMIDRKSLMPELH